MHQPRGLVGNIEDRRLRPVGRSSARYGAEGDRTPDLVTASHALSQLSYSPKRVIRGHLNTQHLTVSAMPSISSALDVPLT